MGRVVAGASADGSCAGNRFWAGVAIALMSRVVISGSVVGIDHSEVMLQQAKKRNASAIEQGRVQLRLASVADFLPVTVVMISVSWSTPSTIATILRIY